MLASPLRISFGVVAVYAVPAEGGIALIDAGLPGGEDKILSTLAEHGFQPTDIRLIVITHAHADHIGALAEVAQRSGAPVLVHEADAPIVASGNPPAPGGLTMLGKVASALMTPFVAGRRATPYTAAIKITGDRSLADFGVAGMAIATPGHTPGSLSVVMDDGNAFVGDLCSKFTPFGSALPPFGDSREAIRAGWRRVLTAGARTIYPGHGGEFPADHLRAELESRETGSTGASPARVALFVGLGIVAGFLSRRLFRRA